MVSAIMFVTPGVASVGNVLEITVIIHHTLSGVVVARRLGVDKETKITNFFITILNQNICF